MKFMLALVSLFVVVALASAAVANDKLAVSIRVPPSGEPYTRIPVNSDDKIKVLREKVTEGDNWKAKYSYLLFNNQLLSDERSVGSYGLWNASLVDYVVWAGSLPSQDGRIYIENLEDGKFTKLPFKVTDTVGSLMEFVHKQFNVADDSQYLLFEGRLLADQSAPLSHYNVKDNSCIGWVAHAN